MWGSLRLAPIMSTSASSELLDKLDELLTTAPSLPCYSDDLNDPDYTLQHEQYHKVSIDLLSLLF